MDELNIVTTQIDELKNTPDKLDKFMDYLLGRGKLKPAEEKMLENYRKAFSWRCKGFSPQHVKQMLMQDASIEYAMAARILQEATRLYGRVEDIDKEGTRRILIENLGIAMSIAIKGRDANAVISAVEKIAKISKIYDDMPQLNPLDMMPAKNITFNRIDINNYHPTPEVNAEDAEYGD
jgi:hypothetical protein